MHEPFAICTVALIVVTVVVSLIGFQNRGFCERHLFSVEEILAGKQYHRLVTSAFLHADGRHLAFNMLSLFLFGPRIEFFLGSGRFLLVYFAAILGGDLLSLWVHRHHIYRAYGASGGVAGVIFSFVLIFPDVGISMYFIPVFVPGWLYAILYLVVSFVGLKRGMDNVGHDAHIGGAVIGLWTTAAFVPDLAFAHWKVFLGISGLSILVFLYLAKNPLFLPLSVFLPAPWEASKREPLPRYKREAIELDAVLEKISRTGIESLTEAEKAVLNSASTKYRRRADSQKPKSGLTI